MSYQALLFCPDEKTARTVTQVLGELDFNVDACSEPFAAVKKLMGERFDAVVVDCDNEQNATLLFKSARNAPNNQAALAVAVVEGQAGVAKAFRIGANLVLTKPINVEQAKGTLRVARGLLRKNEGAKPPNSIPTTASKPAATPARPAEQIHASNVTEMKPAAPAAPKTPDPVIPIHAPASQPSLVASAPIEINHGKPEPAETSPAQPATKSAQSVAAKIIAVSSSTTPDRKTSSGSAASAPAPARETKSSEAKSSTSVEEKPAGADEPAAHGTKAESANKAFSSHAAPVTSSAPSLTFGGTVSAEKPAASGSKTKSIVAVAVAVVLLAAAGYAAWGKFNTSGSTSASARAVTSNAAIPAPVRAIAPNASAPGTSPAAETSAPGSQPSETTKTATGAKASAHPAKPAAESSKRATSKESATSNEAEDNSSDTASAAAAPAPRPMMIKNDRGKASRKNAESTDAPALSAVAIAPSSAALPDLMGPNNAPTPVLQKLIISQGVSRGLLIKEVQPVYPRTAISLHIEGAVQIMATVSKSGDISETKIISGQKELANAAVAAVKQWKYKPYLLNGEPVDIQTQITVNFKLPR